MRRVLCAGAGQGRRPPRHRRAHPRPGDWVLRAHRSERRRDPKI